MKPKELLLSSIDAFLAPRLSEMSFKFAPSKLAFSRTAGHIRQMIEFSLSRWNHENSCTFWTMWSAQSLAYKKWHREKLGEDPPNNCLGGVSDWNIPGWSRSAAEHATLTHEAAPDKSVMERLFHDVERSGLPFLERISTWEGAAQHYLEGKRFFDRAADFLMIAGKLEPARAALLEGIRQFADLGQPDYFGELPRLRARLKQFFGATTE